MRIRTGEIPDRGIHPHGHPRVCKSSNRQSWSGRRDWEHSTAIEPNRWLRERPHRGPLIRTGCQVTHTVGANGRCIDGALHCEPSDVPRAAIATVTFTDRVCLPAERRVRRCRRGGRPRLFHHGQVRIATPVCDQTVVSVHGRSQSGIGWPGLPKARDPLYKRA